MNPEYVKMFQSLQNDKDYMAVRNKIVKENFDRIKKEILNDFNRHPITESTVFFDIPSAADIFTITPMPWASGRSWAKGIESGISGLGYYLKIQKNSRSGIGVQSQKQVRSGARFKNTQYISDLINRFSNKLKDLEKLNT